jgi:poly(A)-specific ribonuclease
VVSQKNWATTWPLLQQAIREADFVAVDYELTGLHEKQDERYVGIAQSYEAHCQGVKTFIPIQLGICAAKYRVNKWSLTPASIYMQPRGDTFSVSMSALSFLGSNGFNFNEWVSDGLGWLSPGEEEERRSMIQARIDEIRKVSNNGLNTKNASEQIVGGSVEITNADDKVLIDSIRSQIQNWLKTDIEMLEVPIESAFQRLLAHTVISQEFPSLFSHSVRRDDQRFLCIYRNQAGLFKDQETSLNFELKKLSEEIKIRSIFDEISTQKIPFVGHNCFYDLLHTYHSFYGPVPPYVDQFKQKWVSKFPRTFDTKYLAEANDVLGGLQPPATLKGLCDFMINGSHDAGGLVSVSSLGNDQKPYQLPEETTDLSHDAGYDAMMTSYVFILQLKHIMERRTLSFDQVEWGQKPAGPSSKIAIHDLLRTACNRVRLVKTQPPSINLKERE